MITFKLNGKPIEIATSWDELTYNQFYETFSWDGSLKHLIWICNWNDVTLKTAGEIQGNIDALIVALNFIKKPAQWNDPVNQCGPYKLPINHKGQYNIQYEDLQQFEDMRSLMNKIEGATTEQRTKSIASLYLYFLAIYLQKIRDGEYSYNKAMDMVEEIKTYPAREVVTLGSFFLVKLTNLLNGTPASSPTTAPNLKKKKQGMAGSKKRSARLPRSRK